MEEKGLLKFKEVLGSNGGSAFKKYRKMVYGDVSLYTFIKAELLNTLISPIPGAIGLFLRKKLYPSIFKSIGKNVIFGKNIVFRHPKKISIGNNVIIDDNCVIDAKGVSNRGIIIGDNVYIGRNTIVYCKNGDILIKQNVNISSNCQLFSSNKLTLLEDSVIGAYSYFLSGGEYDYRDKRKFSEQDGMETKGELVIGKNCWIGARVTVLDAATIGDHCVIGAGAVVTKPIPSNSIAVGIPARVIGSI